MYCVGLKWAELLTRTRVVIWFGKKERSESVLAGHLRYAVCAKRKLMYIYIYIYIYICIQSVQRQNHVMGATVTKKQVSHFGLCHGTHEYLTMIFYTKT